MKRGKQGKTKMAKAAIPIEQIPQITKINSSVEGFDFTTGSVILLDKPKGWSSFKGVKLVRKNANIKKVGHAGTLDPMATGLLIICTGKATKSIDQIQQMPKRYIGEITFGSSTPSYDAETETDQTADWKHITEDAIQKTISEQFSGLIRQEAPAYSALKHKGKPLYKYARAGEEVVKKVRDVTIHEFTVVKYDFPRIIVDIACSKGTYIRSIAHDLGLALGSRAHLSALRRTEIGDYHVSDAFEPEEFADLFTTEQ